MSLNLPFTKCLHPVEVKTLRGVQLVRCGKCAACENSKRSELRAKVQYEETHSKHCFFITLTYSDTYLPLFALREDTMELEEPIQNGFYLSYSGFVSVPTFNENGYRDGAYITYDKTNLCSVRRGYFPLQERIQKDKYNKRLDASCYDIDTDLYCSCILRSTIDSDASLLEDYHRRLRGNVASCRRLKIANNSLSWYHSSQLSDYASGISASDCIPLLYYPDFQRFMKRLRKLLTKKFGKNNEETKVRYYAIGEYGTSSYRPHWHLLLFINSDEVSTWLHDSFTKDSTLSSKQRTIYTSSILCSLWKYGSCTIDKTDGNASGYVSNYVVGSASLPKILSELAPQKAFHSIRFGCPYSSDEITQMLHERNYEKFTHIEYLDSVSHSYKSRPLWRSYYSLFFPQFTGVNSLTDEEKYRVLKIYPKLVDFFDCDNVSTLAKCVYECIKIKDESFSGSETSDTMIQIGRFFDWFEFTPFTKRTLSPIINILYASKRFLSLSAAYGFTPREYFDIWRNFVNYRDNKALKQHYYDCRTNEIYKVDYYSIYGTSKIDMHYLNDSALYHVFKVDALRQNQNLVKHKKLVEQLKGI